MNVAFIPVRGGSKSIPLKNIKEIAGKPLVYWSIKAACECTVINKVYVSTDSSIIRNVVENIKKQNDFRGTEKIEIIDRSSETASDTASTESAMLEFANNYSFEHIVLIQATSPLITSSDLDQGFETYSQDDCDSVLSVVRQKRFCWDTDEAGYAYALNYDYYKRPRRQDFKGYLVENGAFYITSRKALLKTGNRLSGRIKTVEMCEESFLEIDEPSDWEIIENLMLKKNSISSLYGKRIRMFLTDCDGCLTDGGMYYSEKGDELKKFNAKDGMAISILKQYGVITGVLTGENRELNKRRFDKLGFDIIEQDCKDKLSKIKEITKRYKISLDEILYVGDDINDLEALKIVGYSCCPSDAHKSVKKIAKYVSTQKGGDGVVRDIVEIMRNRF